MSGARVSRGLGAVALAMVSAVACSSPDDAGPDPGRTIEVFGPYRGAEADRLIDSLDDYAESAGVEIRYTGSADLVADLTARVVDAADPPDLAIVPQPGLIDQFIDDGSILAVSDATTEQLEANYAAATTDVVRRDDAFFGVPFRRTLKSVVWYRRDLFERRGWAVPADLDELATLTETIAASDPELSPWCFSLEAGKATGWAATDWLEDLVLRRSGADTYDRWIRGEVAFSDPAVTEALEEFRSLVLGPGRVAGGLADVVSVPVNRTWEPLLATEPGCAMYRQADFAIGWMPDDTAVGSDAALDWFVLPGADGGVEPIVFGGDAFVQFVDREEVDALMAHLAGPDAGVSWVESGGFLSAKSSIPSGRYPDTEQRFVEVLADQRTLVFDQSDQLRPDIGSGLLWEQFTLWTTGAISDEEFGRAIDDARRAPTSR